MKILLGLIYFQLLFVLLEFHRNFANLLENVDVQILVCSMQHFYCHVKYFFSQMTKTDYMMDSPSFQAPWAPHYFSIVEHQNYDQHQNQLLVQYYTSLKLALHLKAI